MMYEVFAASNAGNNLKFQVVRKEKMLEEEPERLELALRRCKKLTGTLVTLKRYLLNVAKVL